MRWPAWSNTRKSVGHGHRTVPLSALLRVAHTEPEVGGRHRQKKAGLSKASPAGTSGCCPGFQLRQGQGILRISRQLNAEQRSTLRPLFAMQLLAAVPSRGPRPGRKGLSHWPSSGRWETRIAAVNGPIPGTVRYKEARWARGALRCNAAWYSRSNGVRYSITVRQHQSLRNLIEAISRRTGRPYPTGWTAPRCGRNHLHPLPE